MRLENMSPSVYVPWMPADDVVHVAWRASPDLYTDYYTVCEPLRRRSSVEGMQLARGAVITCVRCVAGRP